jgi:hypothetical protein
VATAVAPVIPFDVIPAKLSIASKAPTEQRTKASKTRGLKTPNREAGFFRTIIYLVRGAEAQTLRSIASAIFARIRRYLIETQGKNAASLCSQCRYLGLTKVKIYFKSDTKKSRVPLPNALGYFFRVNDCYGGSAVPDLDFTVETSELLITPLMVTSVRKLVAFAAVPLCDYA